MIKKTTVVLSNADLNALVMANATNGIVKVTVPRKGGGGPTATVKIGAEDFKAALGAALEMEESMMAALDMSVKQDGTVEITFSDGVADAVVEEVLEVEPVVAVAPVAAKTAAGITPITKGKAKAAAVAPAAAYVAPEVAEGDAAMDELDTLV